MFVYRVARRKYANDLQGEGSRLFGGRWNKKLIPCLYTSQSRALAILEYTVNVNIDEIPRALCLVVLEIEDKQIHVVNESELPGNWKQANVPKETQEFGSALLLDPGIEIIKIPSTIVPQEYNFLINPLHYKHEIKIVSITDFIYDIRIKVV